MIIIAAALLLEAMGAAQYFMATYGTEAELLEKAKRDMDQSLRVAAVKSEVETAIRNIGKAVELSIDNPQGFYRISAGLVSNNQHIVGAGVAFRPDYYKTDSLARLYAPYVYDRQPNVSLKKKKTQKAIVTATLLPFDYTTREWYQKTISDGKSMWSQPYVDQGGTHIIMCTFAAPVRDRNGITIGVLFADVPMEDVSVLSMNFHQGIIDSRTVLFIIQVVSLVIICLIVWLAVRAFRRYKDRYVDPEKDLLIEKVEKMREVNTRLTKRNQELAEKVAELRNRLAVGPQQSNEHWFG